MSMKRALGTLTAAAILAVFFASAGVVNGAIPSDHEGSPLTGAPMVAVPVASPTLAVAGSTFTVNHAVTTGDTGAVLMAGHMICDPSVQGVVLHHAEYFVGGTAGLRFKIPADAGGKLLKVHVTITLRNKTYTRVSYFHILPRVHHRVPFPANSALSKTASPV